MPYLLEVTGDYALFSRPELAVERMSYDVITPSAARGMLDSIYWHPGIRWSIERVYVLSPIRFMSIRRNEVTQKALGSSMLTAMNGKPSDNYIVTPSVIAQRASLVLRDVRYVVKARFDLTENAAPGDNQGKFSDIIRRRLEKGQFYSMPYLGCREFPATVTMWEGSEADAQTLARNEHAGARDLGLMLYDLDYTDTQNITPMYFRARLVDGLLNVAGEEVYR
ncbi:MAG: type I-C CRISPR-associated protein Cas5c [Christensenellales bacterium]|jgi:CRISPR-associated protein Cas5d